MTQKKKNLSKILINFMDIQKKNFFMNLPKLLINFMKINNFFFFQLENQYMIQKKKNPYVLHEHSKKKNFLMKNQYD